MNKNFSSRNPILLSLIILSWFCVWCPNCRIRGAFVESPSGPVSAVGLEIEFFQLSCDVLEGFIDIIDNLE